MYDVNHGDHSQITSNSHHEVLAVENTNVVTQGDIRQLRRLCAVALKRTLLGHGSRVHVTNV
jgi:hypothetical protein